MKCLNVLITDQSPARQGHVAKPNQDLMVDDVTKNTIIDTTWGDSVPSGYLLLFLVEFVTEKET